MRGRIAAKRCTFGLIVIAGACAAAPARVPDVQAALEEKTKVCVSCHGGDGNSAKEGIPSLAGQPKMFLIDQLILTREGVRRTELMRPWVSGFDDATIIAIAKHFSALRPRASKGPADPGLFTRGRALAVAGHCGGRHLSDFSGRAQIPRLAGQSEDYLVAPLGAYRDGKVLRPDTTMNNIMFQASDEEIRALAHFLAHANSLQ